MAGTASTTDPKPPITRVRYTGSADVREITAAQWKAAGVDDQKLTRWSIDTNFSVKAEDLSAAALEVLERDGDMKFLTD